jgi:hypothetical protein
MDEGVLEFAEAGKFASSSTHPRVSPPASAKGELHLIRRLAEAHQGEIDRKRAGPLFLLDDLHLRRRHVVNMLR